MICCSLLPTTLAFAAAATIMSSSPSSSSAAIPSIPSSTSSKPHVCVTGCNGYVAAELVKQLLQKGYHVKGTVRSLSQRATKYSFLDRLAKESNGGGSLDVYEADLQVPGSFDEAVQGCQYVFHVASPVVYDTTDPEKDLVRPAVEGAVNVLHSIAKAKAKIGSPFKRLILTSSTGAIFGPGSQAGNGRSVYNEEDWNESCSVTTLPYYYSKVAAEKKAWEVAKKEGIDMIAVHPAYVWGPPAAKEAGSFNTERLRGVLKGEQKPWSFDFPVCDSRDIARVQIAAAEQPKAHGRFIISTAETVTPRWIAQTIQQRFPDHFPQMGKVDESIASKELFDNTRVQRELGVKLRAPEETLCDMIQAILNDDEEMQKEKKP